MRPPRRGLLLPHQRPPHRNLQRTSEVNQASSGLRSLCDQLCRKQRSLLAPTTEPYLPAARRKTGLRDVTLKSPQHLQRKRALLSQETDFHKALTPGLNIIFDVGSWPIINVVSGACLPFGFTTSLSVFFPTIYRVQLSCHLNALSNASNSACRDLSCGVTAGTLRLIPSN